MSNLDVRDANTSEMFTRSWKGVIIIAVACTLFFVGFAVPATWGVCLSLFAILPILYGSHEALHETLVPETRHKQVSQTINDFFLVVGSALQFMNFRLLRPAHQFHHVYGRYDDGYAPDVLGHEPRFVNYMRFYLNLCGRPALLWQMVCLAAWFIPLKRLPFSQGIQFKSEKSSFPYWLAQLLIIVVVVYTVVIGGWFKFAIYELVLCFIWSLLQNVSHYGLKGFDPLTDRVCARTYYLPEPFHSLTFGSTCHLAHHVFENVPGPNLNKAHVITNVENKLCVTIEIKYGIVAFLKDVFRQFRGPMSEDKLDTSWAKRFTPLTQFSGQMPGKFGLRSGRTWERTKNT